MIINGNALLKAAPIKDMISEKRRLHGVSWGLGEAGYDIRIKQQIEFNPYYNPPMTYIDIYQNVVGRFIIASAIEEFDMPNNLVGIVHDKSSWARKGLSVFNTVIEPGWKGFLTLELVFHGSEPVHIPAGAAIAQVIFHETACRAEYNGKYQNQEDMPIASIMD